jgi:hypothetical protein
MQPGAASQAAPHGFQRQFLVDLLAGRVVEIHQAIALVDGGEQASRSNCVTRRGMARWVQITNTLSPR